MGQLFVAREAGPELVGTLGGHTAVMNNDQIVSSVSAGVARAISNIRFYLAGGYDGALERIGGIILEARDRINDIRGSVEHIAYMMSSPSFVMAGGPAMAQGTVIPPQILSATTDLSSIRSALDRLTASLDNGGRGGDYRFTAEINRRVLFDEMLDEGQLRQAQTGNNPFNI